MPPLSPPFTGHAGVRFHGPDTFITAQSLCRKWREDSGGWREIYQLNSGSDRPWSEMSWVGARGAMGGGGGWG